MPRSVLLPLLAALLALTGLTAAAPASAGAHVHADGTVHDHGPPEHAPARGLRYDGLERSQNTNRCDRGFAFTAPGLEDLCTHGPDAGPEGVDVRTATTAPVTAAEAAAVGDLACDGDGTSGFRAEAVYVHLAGTASNYATYLPSFRTWAAKIQQDVAASTVEHDPTATPQLMNFVHTPTGADGSCELVVHELTLSSTAADSFGNTIDELQALGFDDPTRNYLIWMDARVLCGIGTLYGDSRPDPALNYNNFGYAASYSRADAGCWDYAETHELLHNMGAVQNDAPNSSGGYHCNDDRDVMCYADGGSTSGMFVDPACEEARFERMLDCNGDDYYNPSPEPGSYLASHWNTADSYFLFTQDGGGGGGGDPDPGPDPDPDPVTETFTGSLNKKRTSETFGFSTGAGTVTVVLDDGTTGTGNAPGGKGGGKGGGGKGGGTVTWTLELRDAAGTTVDSASGSGRVTIGGDQPEGDYSIVVGGGKGGYVVTVTHP